MQPSFLAAFNSSPFVQKLKLRETFPAADIARGTFTPDNWHDDARLNRTSAWLLDHCQGMWRRRVDQPAGLVTYEFEVAAEANAFRVATATLPGMILCQ